VPEWASGGLGFPERGTRIEGGAEAKLELLSVAEGQTGQIAPAGGLLH
jgi:hypothetical protein